MMMRIRALIAYALVAVVVLTGQVMATARTMPDATGEMVICTGSGAVTVHLDEDGNPTGPPHICPDCVMSLLVAVDASGVMPLRDAGLTVQVFADHAAGHISRPALSPSARGPPV